MEIAALRIAIFEQKRRVTFVTGAGISVKSGIPLYRSAPNETKKNQRLTASVVRVGSHSTPLPDSPEIHVGTTTPSCSDEEHDKLSNDVNAADDAAEEDGAGKGHPVEGHPVEEHPVEEHPGERGDDRASSSASSVSAEPTAIWDAKLEALATRSAFRCDPRGWYGRFWMDTHHVDAFLGALPNESHYAISHMCNDPELRVSCITQNVDNLHRKSGIREDKLVEIHGRIGLYRCLQPGCLYNHDLALRASDLVFLNEDEELRAKSHPVFCLGLKPSRRLMCASIYAADDAAGKPDPLKHRRLPGCPACRLPVIPLTLLFDENYQCHTGFGFDTAVRWVDESEIIVFCGTSFSVFFTSHVTLQAVAGCKMVFNINIREEAKTFEMFRDYSGRDRVSHLRWNFDSDVENDSPPPSPGEHDGSQPSFTLPNQPTVAHILGPADETLLALIPPLAAATVLRRVADGLAQKDVEFWDVPPNTNTRSMRCND